jgi:hypothetical protein
MIGQPNSTWTSGAKALVFGALNVAAEAATHKEYTS